MRFDTFCSEEAFHRGQNSRVVVAVSTSRSRDVPTSRLGIVSRKIVNVSVSSRSREADVSVSAIYVSCPRPIFDHIVHATLIQRVNFACHGNASLSQPHQLVRYAFIQVESASFLMSMQMAPYAVLTGFRRCKPMQFTIAHHINTLKTMNVKDNI